jgi:hypothetical protein
MKAPGLILLFSLAAFAQKVQIESDPEVDFGKYKTFTIAEGRLNSKNPELNGDLIRKKIQFDIKRNLEAKGLTYVESGPSDLNVRFTLGANRKIERDVYPAGWRGWGTRVVRVPYTEGTLVIDLFDRGSKSMVWRGISREEKSDASKIEGRLDNMVKKPFDKYPPKAK